MPGSSYTGLGLTPDSVCWLSSVPVWFSGGQVVRFMLRRTLSGIVALLVIIYLSSLAQDAAASSRSGQGLPLHQVAGNALGDTGRLLGGLL